MDQQTRNKLQNATQDARRLLEQEFAEQLEGTYDILPDGKILPEPGKHLDDHGRLRRQKLVDAIEHIHAGGKKPAEAVDEYTREAAFTFLNRFVALKMLEARGLVQQCVSKGDQSSGFKEFTGLAPGLAELPDRGYRLYLECLFDELSIEVKVLFDRRDPASLLWPRRQALTDLLAILNQPELANVWDQDETIGWVYQYFNSQEERRKMREESQAPRNSRELAVRNQFFTPRYVVEFLTDNTLGRIWYEMRQGDTRLAEQCQYLVRRPTEIFLAEGEAPAKQEADEDLSQEELLKQPVHIPFRAKKDPRDLKILDPACGSGHFLLYCFDLLVTIYEEAWADGQSSTSEGTGQSLREDYATIEVLREAVPGLILRHNLHGIDIDPRCAQIAAFALWMRAQRAYSDFGFDRASRPAIRRANIVVAEPMPGEKDLLKEFAATLKSKELGQLVEIVFDKMQLAGEAGSLLRIEDELRRAVREIYGEHGDLFRKSDEARWENAESQLLAALRQYAEQSSNGRAYRRSLFAGDAVRGLGFIGLCQQHYSVVLMNPPFGEASVQSRPYIAKTYADTKGDVYQAFIESFQSRLAPSSFMGIISSRTGLFLAQATDWRERVFFRLYRPVVLADLGFGVLDAMVETAAYVLRTLSPVEIGSLGRSLLSAAAGISADLGGRRSIARYEKARSGLKRHQAIAELQLLRKLGFVRLIDPPHFMLEEDVCLRNSGSAALRLPPLVCIRLVGIEDKETALISTIRGHGNELVYVVEPASLRLVPNTPIAYWVHERVRRLFTQLPPFKANGRHASLTNPPGDDQRYFRCHWEVPVGELGRDARWVPMAKGGDYSQFHSDIHLVVDWCEKVGSYRGFLGTPHRPLQRPASCEHFFRPGLTWPRSTVKGLNVRPLNRGAIFADKGPGAFIPGDSDDELCKYLALLNSQCFEELMFLQHGSRAWEVGVLNRTPVPKLEARAAEELAFRGRQCAMLKQSLDFFDETTHSYYGPEILLAKAASVSKAIQAWRDWHRQLAKSYAASKSGIEQVAFDLYGLDQGAFGRLESDGNGASETDRAEVMLEGGDLKESEFAARLVSYLLGCALGRWDITVTRGRQLAELVAREPFSELPKMAPAAVKEGTQRASNSQACADGLRVDDVGHPDDVVRALEKTLDEAIGESAGRMLTEVVATLASANDLRTWLRRCLFEDHVRRYSKSRRKAPIYWQLATPSASYSVWLYYHRFTQDTFFKVLNDFVKPKLDHEQRKLDRLRADAGPEPTRSQRAEIDQQETFVAELKTFAEEIERIAPLWNPDLNDGVSINFAPLWRLVPQHKAWQKECKACWDKLVAGDYDWAHLAMHLWPERVVPKCRTDASLAIAHGLEARFWVQEGGRWRPLREPEEEADAQVNCRVDEARERLVEAVAEFLDKEACGSSTEEAHELLAGGSYDHTRLALLLWPKRVVMKCLGDARLASRLGIELPEDATERVLERMAKRYAAEGCPELGNTFLAAFEGVDERIADRWRRLADGELDEVPLALELWPGRVIDKCLENLDLARKHGLEPYFWCEDPEGTWRRLMAPDEEQQLELGRREAPAVKAALKSLLDAPAPAGKAKGGRGRRKVKSR